MTHTYQAAAFTSQGPRHSNQDAAQVDATRGYAVVADGMGGAAGGGVASAETVAAVRQVLELGGTQGQDGLRSLLQEACREANRRVCARASSDPALSGMGSTVALVLLSGNHYCAANVGDSRVYLLRSGVLTQLSHDHSLVQDRVDAGIITPDEARVQPDRNVITRAIGVSGGAEPHLVDAPIRHGDRFLITSDGVHGVLREADLAAVPDTETPSETAERLVHTALNRGTTDNATAAVLRVSGAVSSTVKSRPRWTQLMDWLRPS